MERCVSVADVNRLKSEIGRLEREIERLNARAAFPPGGDAHGFLRAVYNSEALPLHVRMDAAKTAIKYETPTLAAVAVQHSDRGIGDRLAKARIQASFPGNNQLLLTDNAQKECSAGSCKLGGN